MVSGAPLLVTVTRCGALSVPSGCSAKVSACGDSGATAARTTAVCSAAGLLGRAAASSPSTRCGSSRADVVPSPSCPRQLAPQLHSPPSAVRANSALVAPTSTTPPRPGAVTGTQRETPSPLSPHETTVPSARSATAWSVPPASALTPLSAPSPPGAATVTGVVIDSGAVVPSCLTPSPSSPYPPYPHALTVPSASSA